MTLNLKGCRLTAGCRRKGSHVQLVVHIGSIPQQQVHDFRVSVLTGDRERGAAVLSRDRNTGDTNVQRRPERKQKSDEEAVRLKSAGFLHDWLLSLHI